ncbi:MAG: hypothetical protein ACREBD_00425, partial [Blastocatellia bacterium]
AYWAENPHALKAGLWLALVLMLLSGKLLLVCGRPLVRKLLARRGWVKPADNIVLKVSETNRGVTPIVDQAGD